MKRFVVFLLVIGFLCALIVPLHVYARERWSVCYRQERIGSFGVCLRCVGPILGGVWQDTCQGPGVDFLAERDAYAWMAQNCNCPR